MTKKTLNVQDVARLIGVSRRTLYNMLNDGRFPVLPISGTSPRRWNLDAVEAWRAGK